MGDLERAVRDRLRGIESGKYRSNNESVLTQFAAWLDRERGVTSVDGVGEQDCRRYAQFLRDDDGLSARSANTYYAYVRAFLGWAVRDGWIDRNPAATETAAEPLPAPSTKPDRQFWTPEERAALLAFVDRRCEDALGGGDVSRERAFRDRAIVRLLALAGVRGAEVFRDPQDERRDGITWNDLDVERGVVEVLGKSGSYEYAQLPTPVCDALDRYRRVARVSTGDSAVFPTEHAPSKYAAARERLESSFDADELETYLENRSIDEIVRDHEIALPSLTTAGARTLMRRLSEAAGLSIDGDYLKPHGARRGLGHELYANGHAELAQAVLRHSSIETTHESYSDIRATETARRVDEALDLTKYER